MPGQKRTRAYDAGKTHESFSADSLGSDVQPASLIIGEVWTLADLRLENPDPLLKALDQSLPMGVHPTGQASHQQGEWVHRKRIASSPPTGQHFELKRHPCSRPRCPKRSILAVVCVSGHYGIGRTLERMVVWLILILHLAAASLKSRRSVLLENLALRQQLLVLNRGSKRPRLTPLDRALWAWLSQVWRAWRTSLQMVQPDTVVRWHRAGFRLFWSWRSRPRRVGRQAIASDTINLIRQMSGANPLWGAPRIHGELLKLGITLA